MALSILDGNQTATTLSTILTGGAHIPAHTVVSLGSQAITDMRSAVSGSVVSISNLPATQTIEGTVTANVGGTVNANIRDGSGNNLTSTSIGGLNRLNVTLSSAGSTGTTAPSYANLHGGSDGTNLRAILTDTSGRTVVTGSASILGTSSVTFTSVSVGSCVTHGVVISNSSVTISGVDVLAPTSPKTHSLSSLSETFSSNNSGYALITKICSDSGNAINPISNIELRASPVTIGGSVTVNNSLTIGSLPSLAAGTAQIGSVTASISGTVTAAVASTTVTVSALPSGALTTRFGSVTTANTAQLTAAVTNTSRKYLLAQNISAGTVTIGIGFSPTTTQGIQLTAGGGLTFDAFCPTGAVYWLGAVTGAAFTILEG